MSDIRKVVRDGKVAVLYSPGYGAGWSTWNSEPGLAFLPEVVEWVENGKKTDIDEILAKAYPDSTNLPYSGGAEELEIEWLPKGTQFYIHEYDGSEIIKFRDSDDWGVA